MSSFAIFGSGFGLYGYLPALISCGQCIVLPERYRTRFDMRPELAQFADRVEWAADESVALERAAGVIFALEPSLQHDRLMHCLPHPHIERLLLEKPLSRSPESAAVLFDHLMRTDKIFRIGYLFRYTAWGKQLLAALSANDISKISIQWEFCAHHFRQNVQTWKRSHTVGGGVIRFYGIHVVALLAEAGYSEVVLSETTVLFADEYEKWKAVFIGKDLPRCEVVIDSRSSINRFHVKASANKKPITIVFANLRDPFDLGDHTCPLDQRVPVLSQLCQSLWKSDTNEYHWYAATIKLWRAIEERNRLEERKETLIEKKIN